MKSRSSHGSITFLAGGGTVVVNDARGNLVNRIATKEQQMPTTSSLRTSHIISFGRAVCPLFVKEEGMVRR